MAYSEEEISTFKTEILGHVSNGLSLKKTLDINKHLPSRPTVYQWLNKDHEDYDKEFFNNYVRAREERAENIFEEILTISDSTEDDVIINEDGMPITNHNVIQRDRLRVESRKWMLSKMQPKKYGDKLDLTSKGEQLKSPTSIPLVLQDGKTYEELKDELTPE